MPASSVEKKPGDTIWANAAKCLPIATLVVLVLLLVSTAIYGEDGIRWLCKVNPVDANGMSKYDTQIQDFMKLRDESLKYREIGRASCRERGSSPV